MPHSRLTAIKTSGPHLPSRRGLLRIVAAAVLVPLWPEAGDGAAARKRAKRRKQRKRRKDRPDPRPVARVAASCAAPKTLSFGLIAPQRLAQTFTAATSGSLIRAELLMEKEAQSLGDYFLHVGTVDNFGVPTNEVLAVASISNPEVPAGVSTVTFRFPNPVALTAGAQYALVLNRSGTELMTWHGVQADPCGGLSFKSANQTAPFTPFGSGLDLIYRAFVQ